MKLTLGKFFLVLAIVLFVLVAVGVDIGRLPLLPLGLASLAAGHLFP